MWFKDGIIVTNNINYNIIKNNNSIYMEDSLFEIVINNKVINNNNEMTKNQQETVHVQCNTCKKCKCSAQNQNIQVQQVQVIFQNLFIISFK